MGCVEIAISMLCRVFLFSPPLFSSSAPPLSSHSPEIFCLFLDLLISKVMEISLSLSLSFSISLSLP
jgi:hypothetical protein